MGPSDMGKVQIGLNKLLLYRLTVIMKCLETLHWIWRNLVNVQQVTFTALLNGEPVHAMGSSDTGRVQIGINKLPLDRLNVIMKSLETLHLIRRNLANA
jgi:hypothetical protein